MKEPLSVQSNKNRKINIVRGEGGGEECVEDARKANFPALGDIQGYIFFIPGTDTRERVTRLF